jgi:hypothetical protein
MSPFAVIILAGSICGILDLISASILFLARGGTFERLLQFIASGALGESSFRGGKKDGGARPDFPFRNCVHGSRCLLRRQPQLAASHRAANPLWNSLRRPDPSVYDIRHHSPISRAKA